MKKELESSLEKLRVRIKVLESKKDDFSKKALVVAKKMELKFEEYIKVAT